MPADGRCGPAPGHRSLAAHRPESPPSAPPQPPGCGGCGGLVRHKPQPRQRAQLGDLLHMGYSQDKPETRSRKRFPWSAGVPVESSGGTPTRVVQSFREDSFSEANPALASENPELSAGRPGHGYREQAVPLAARPGGQDGRGPRRTARPAHCGFRAYLGCTPSRGACGHRQARTSRLHCGTIPRSPPGLALTTLATGSRGLRSR